ncbi:MAG: 16S rRNA (cytidine(1402)-2'-O)-methyltransferase [Gammaproteobacteria bacterium]|nr:16S rRNA (cytidine(1402)-2'-O)-methyltransferase [Gammaproteobacteria bacterium]
MTSTVDRPALAVVATPIGNLGDITARAVETLKASDMVLAEDTRNTGRLLAHLGINATLKAVHDHNERDAAPGLLEKIKQSEMLVSLVSDAGTPTISDPGYHLVRAAHAAGINVFAVPGACAAIAALSVAGLPSNSFTFEGFLPPRATARLDRLRTLSTAPQTTILYEAPHRLAALLDDVATVYEPTREIVIARELTKLHETLYRGTVADIRGIVEQDAYAERGELVVLLGPAAEQASADQARVLATLKAALRYLGPRDAAHLTAELTGAKPNAVYKMSLDLANADPHS